MGRLIDRLPRGRFGWSPLLVVALNVVGSGILHAVPGRWAHRLPDERLAMDGPLLRLRPFEARGRWYERRLRINRWKDAVPEAGALLAGGRSKRRLGGRDDAALEGFVRETRRAERAHWLTVAGAPLFAVWNPTIGWAAMLVYGVASNLPCIAIQRYNRARLVGVLADRSARVARSARSSDG